MKKIKILLTFLILSISFWSCQNEDMPVENSLNGNSGILDKTIDKAILYLQVVDGAGNYSYDLNVHKVTTDWMESEVTWNSPWVNPGGDYSETPVASKFVDNNSYDSDRVLAIDITKLWEGGTPKNGLILKIADASVLLAGKRLKFSSREEPDPLPSTITTLYPPLVEITYFEGNNEIVAYQVLGDAEIISVDGKEDNNYGSKIALYAGKSDSDFELRSVIKFDFPEDTLPEDGTTACTHTRAYWKTHAKGKKKDATWDLLPDGTKTKFFTSKKSYHNIISRRSWGNPYYVLAAEYAAVELNFLNKTNPTDIQTSFDAATTIFYKYNPKQLKKMQKDREFMKQLIDLTADLRAYNIGDNGPGHCDDPKWKHDDKDWKKWWKKFLDKKKWDKKKWDKKKWDKWWKDKP